MTAFAAVVAPDESLVTDTVVGRVGAALKHVTGAPVGAARSGRCALLLSPLHAAEPVQPIVDAQSGLAVTGQVLLEDRQGLIQRLQLPPEASDLAIVAAAFIRWGDGFTAQLSGEYAFALWDPAQHALVCARDGLGIRLLYVGEAGPTIVASNTIRAVLAHPSCCHDLDHARLVAFLASGRVSTQTRTAYRAVHAVPEGHTLSIQALTGQQTLCRHWWMPAPDTLPGHDSQEILEGYRDALASAVNDRAGSGPVSIFLSGGLDSTTIAAAARQANPRAPLHALVFPGNVPVKLNFACAFPFSMLWDEVTAN